MLHGEVKVNNKIIAWWSARRITEVRDVNVYETSVRYLEPDGTEHIKAGLVTHQYSKGALVLAQEVLDWATFELADIFEG